MVAEARSSVPQGRQQKLGVSSRKDPATTGMPESEGTPAEVGIDKADKAVAGTLALATILEAAEKYKKLNIWKNSCME